ncbi:MAG: DoxX family protein [Verrucomicrobia bacterium]|nr:DoxX family protein [Verrucomicrobiota bacterium]
MKYIFLLGRILFSSIFLIKSLEHFSKEMITHATHAAVPMPSLLVPIAGIIAFLGGLSILLGYRAKVGAWLLVIFLLPTTFMIHRFWVSTDFFSNMMHQYCFFKNLSLLGASLMIAYFGSGPLSLDNK